MKTVKDRIRFGMIGGIAVLIGGYFVLSLMGHSRYSIYSRFKTIPYIVLLVGLLILGYAIFGKAKKNEDPKTNDQQIQEPGL